MSDYDPKKLEKLRLATDDGKRSVILASQLENEWLSERSEVTLMMREWERMGLGRMILGRRGHDTRLQLGTKALKILTSVCGNSDASVIGNQEQIDLVETTAVTTRMTAHSFQLRSDLEIELSLPSDLTEREAGRIAKFVESLPM